ncbi:MAG TPA: VOC family protein [Candidatus Limnocylindria bacterium]|jgi:catechol 2,3-dioxygenase-like lactoylglutathione lyase family enzyme|nr:VOC family protein [Candidatus Limnocylindria bacterium]
MDLGREPFEPVRRVVRRGAAALLCAVLLAVSPAGPSAAEPGTVRAVGTVALAVEDLDRSVAFYTSVLDFVEIDRGELAGAPYERLEGIAGLRVRVARLALGDERITLQEYLTPKGRPVPADSRGNDRWFQHVAVITSDMDRAYARLRAAHVRAASSAPQRLPDWNANAAGIRAYYFRDPDGHYLEILQFPPDKGAAKWHAGASRLFLGIDHTAIVVRDTEVSLRFYRDALGMRVVGGSENYGPEQERLSGVAGAHVRITTLRAPAGPGIEFLQYLAPADGRSAPADERANDLVSWQTTVAVDELPGPLGALRAAGASLVSTGPVTLPGGSADGAVVVRDPDGHAIELVTR